jgi:hypothetical protein
MKHWRLILIPPKNVLIRKLNAPCSSDGRGLATRSWYLCLYPDLEGVLTPYSAAIDQGVSPRGGTLTRLYQ